MGDVRYLPETPEQKAARIKRAAKLGAALGTIGFFLLAVLALFAVVALMGAAFEFGRGFFL